MQGLAGQLNAEQSKQLGMARDSARHLLELINDVLDLSRIEAGQMEVVRAPFDMRTAVESALSLAGPLAARKNLTLNASFGSGVGPVVSDRRRVEQILINLVNNAIKFTVRGRVDVECSVANGSLLTTVKDTGIGVQEDKLALLFRPFQQIESGLGRRHEGTGLGLSICKQLVELLGGQMEVRSKYGEGSAFSFRLPLGGMHG